MKRDISFQKNDLISLLVLAFILWVVHYWNVNSYGLYEDDLTIIPQAIQMSIEELVKHVSNYILSFEGQGRPLHHSFIFLFSNIGFRINGLSGIYLLGFMIELLNGFFLYLLVRRIHPSRALALLSGISFVLFPADTTKIYLTHSLGLHPAIFFILIGLHCRLSGYRFLSYILASLALLCYESVFPVFLVAPLLTYEWNKRMVKRLLEHLIIMMVILGVVFLIRILMGENRVSSLGVVTIATTPLLHMVQGPPVALGTYLYRPMQVLLSQDLFMVSFIVAVTLIFSWFIYRFFIIDNASGDQKEQAIITFSSRYARQWIESHLREVKIIAIGSAMLVASYALTFTTRAYAITGRDTRVHAAAIIGSSILFGVIAYLTLNIQKSILRRLAFMSLMTLLVLLAVFGFQVQQEYVTAWRLQQEFWAQLLPLIQDVEPGSAVLIDPSGLEDTHQIWANHWNLPRVLVQLYIFPDSWQPVPRVYRLVPEWRESILNEDGEFQLNVSTVVAPPSTYQDVQSTQVIIIGDEQGHFVRQESPININGIEFGLKPLSNSSLRDRETRLLFDLLMDQ